MSPAARGQYATPQALERALTDLLRADARRRPGVQVDSLRRQFAYDRLLTRVFTGPDADRWVLKGATAMLARLSGDARHTRDIDLYRQGDDLTTAEAALRVAAATDVGDFFRFALNPGQRVTQSRQTLRVPAVAYLGLREFSRFHIDLVTSLVMTGEPDEVSPLVPVLIAGVASTTYRAHPVADHIADKVCAMIETHDRSDGQPQASTRYRDLADLATFARTAVVEAHLLIRALRCEASRRALTLPDKLTVPDVAWGPGYARVARETRVSPTAISHRRSRPPQRSSTPSWTGPPRVPGIQQPVSGHDSEANPARSRNTSPATVSPSTLRMPETSPVADGKVARMSVPGRFRLYQTGISQLS